MTFEEWWAENGALALVTQEVRFQKYWYEDAFKAGLRQVYKDGYVYREIVMGPEEPIVDDSKEVF